MGSGVVEKKAFLAFPTQTLNNEVVFDQHHMFEGTFDEQIRIFPWFSDDRNQGATNFPRTNRAMEKWKNALPKEFRFLEDSLALAFPGNG